MSDKKDLSEEKEADDLIKYLAEKIRSQLEEKLLVKFTHFKPIRYKTQPQATGTNYFTKLVYNGVKPSIAESCTPLEIAGMNNQPNKFIHIRMWHDPTNKGSNVTLYEKIQEGKIASDPIEHFE